MRELSLHILDIVENSIAAGATLVEIQVIEDLARDLLTIVIKDNGRGMPEEFRRRATDPFTTTRNTRKVGLGLPLFASAAEACDGSLVISSKEGVGTTVTATFRESHIDRAPLGDMAATIAAILATNPDIHLRYVHRMCYDGDDKTRGTSRQFIFDSEEMCERLEGVPISNPLVIQFIRGLISEEIESLSRRE